MVAVHDVVSMRRSSPSNSPRSLGLAARFRRPVPNDCELRRRSTQMAQRDDVPLRQTLSSGHANSAGRPARQVTRSSHCGGGLVPRIAGRACDCAGRKPWGLVYISSPSPSLRPFVLSAHHLQPSDKMSSTLSPAADDAANALQVQKFRVHYYVAQPQPHLYLPALTPTSRSFYLPRPASLSLDALRAVVAKTVGGQVDPAHVDLWVFDDAPGEGRIKLHASVVPLRVTPGLTDGRRTAMVLEKLQDNGLGHKTLHIEFVQSFQASADVRDDDASWTSVSDGGSDDKGADDGSDDDRDDKKKRPKSPHGHPPPPPPHGRPRHPGRHCPPWAHHPHGPPPPPGCPSPPPPAPPMAFPFPFGGGGFAFGFGGAYPPPPPMAPHHHGHPMMPPPHHGGHHPGPPGLPTSHPFPGHHVPGFDPHPAFPHHGSDWHHGRRRRGRHHGHEGQRYRMPGWGHDDDDRGKDRRGARRDEVMED